jgi:ATP-binding cassette, subfamily B, bacterial HlyB/CyaB
MQIEMTTLFPKLTASEDVGLLALTIVAKTYHVNLDPTALAHELGLGHRKANPHDIVQAARLGGLKARFLKDQHVTRLSQAPRPSIIRMKTGAYYILCSLDGGIDGLWDPFDTKPKPTTIADICEDWSGQIIVVTHRAPPDLAATRFGFSWFFSAAVRYKTPLIHVLICSFFSQVFALATPLLFQVVVDKVLVHKTVSTLDVVVGSLIFIGLFDVILQYLRSYALYHSASRLDVDLGKQIFQRLFRLPIAYFETRATGQTVARMREIETVRTFLTGQAITALIDATFMIIFLGVLFIYSVTLALIVIGSIPMYVLIASLVRPRLRKKINEKFNRGAASQQYLVESIVGALTLKAAAVEPLLQRQWEERLAAYVSTSFQATMIGSGGGGAIQFINKLVTALTLYFGALAVIADDMTVGQLIAFNMIANQLVQPVLRLSQLWQDLQQVQISIDRIGDIYNAPPEENSINVSVAPHGRMRGSIKLQDVTFRYNPKTPEILSNFTLDIPAGQVLGVVGASGSGKSTLTKLIQRLYVPEHGRVSIDGIDIAQVHPAWFRKQIGVVLQENILFNRTIHENIALAVPGLPRASVIQIARLAGADEFVQKLPQGYDTTIEERGANLSGGQRQRIAIARALARNPRILIFDEATSALDYESEQIIQKNMSDIVQGRTVIIVAHRLAAVRPCHRIIALASGRIIEDGSHDELITNRDGLYRRLWQLQVQPANA